MFVAKLYSLTDFSLLKIVAVFLAHYLEYILAFLVVCFIFHSLVHLGRNLRIAILAVLSGFVARVIIKNIIVSFYLRARPFITLPDIHSLIKIDPNDLYHSFPSGHMIFFFALGSVIYYYNRQWGIIFLAASGLMGIGRIMVGVH